MSKAIILIGPMAAGKTSVARELATLTGRRNVPMDRVRWYYYFKDGFRLEQEYSLPNFADVMAYWKPFEVKAVARILDEFPDSIIDFGAGHSYFIDPEQFATVQKILEPLPDVYLLLPSPDKAKSLEICNHRLAERKKSALDANEIEANRNFIEHESNYRLAKRIFYTDGKTPREVAEAIRAVL